MRRTETILLAVAALGIFACPGCQNPANILHQQQLYALDVHRPDSLPAGVKSPAVLKIRRFSIAPLYETCEFVYRRTDLTFESDFYNRFFSTPAALITEQARTWLTESRIFAHVLDNYSAAHFDCTLEASILTLHCDYRQKGDPRAIMEIQFTLIDENNVRRAAVFQKKYGAAVQTVGGPENLVRGYTTCLTNILSQLEADLADLLVVPTDADESE